MKEDKDRLERSFEEKIENLLLDTDQEFLEFFEHYIKYEIYSYISTLYNELYSSLSHELYAELDNYPKDKKNIIKQKIKIGQEKLTELKRENEEAKQIQREILKKLL